MTAFSCGLYFAMRSKQCVVSSSEEILFLRMASAAAMAVPKSASNVGDAAIAAGANAAALMNSRRFTEVLLTDHCRALMGRNTWAECRRRAGGASVTFRCVVERSTSTAGGGGGKLSFSQHPHPHTAAFFFL